ncbi:Conserved protein of uncharacterised function%2C alanine rich [Mycobacterium tuberculosis]|nr:Conserved protein of uncharacterised function%2C alanine rich [Mycobacterium tuberculosis]
MCPEPSHAGAAESEGTESEPTPLLRPAGGIPDLCVTVGEIAAAAELLDRGRGPFAVDAERASGFRYSGRAYLIQIRRAEAGTVLIDPVSHGGDPLTVLAPVAEVLSTNEWILHSADQDLPCLAEVGMRPPALYDTELAGRLAGFDRVNLAAMVERLLGLGLTKGHGAADWSKRPLPSAWLNYAALDVELLIELRAAISRVLAEQGKTDWAAQEFEHLRSFESRPPPAAARQDRWRRTSGIHKVHDRRGWARSANCGQRVTESPSAATSRPAGSCRTRPLSMPPSPTQSQSTTLSRYRCSADATNVAARLCGGRHWQPHAKAQIRRRSPNRQTGRRRRGGGSDGNRQPPHGWMRRARR